MDIELTNIEQKILKKLDEKSQDLRTIDSKKRFHARELHKENIELYLSRTAEKNSNLQTGDYLEDAVRAFFPSQRIGDNSFVADVYIDDEEEIVLLPVVYTTKKIGTLHELSNKHNIELSIVRAILWKETQKIHNYTYAFAVFDKAYSFSRQVRSKHFQIVVPKQIHDIFNIRKEMYIKIDMVQADIQKQRPSPKCQNIRWMKRKSKNINMSCTYYCQYSDACPHFSTHTKQNNALNKLIF